MWTRSLCSIDASQVGACCYSRPPNPSFFPSKTVILVPTQLLLLAAVSSHLACCFGRWAPFSAVDYASAIGGSAKQLSTRNRVPLEHRGKNTALHTHSVAPHGWSFAVLPVCPPQMIPPTQLSPNPCFALTLLVRRHIRILYSEREQHFFSIPAYTSRG